MKQNCPICQISVGKFFVNVEGYDYFQCKNCDSIFIDSEYLDKIDKGFNIVNYNENYWANELQEAKERAYSVALARMSEVFYYSRIPIKKFIDVGTGPGFFLDAINKYLPDNEHKYFGIEKFPPLKKYRTKKQNYIIGDLINLNMKFDGGMCIEVVEHLTPKMLRNLFKTLANISNDCALYYFNTGMPEFVINEDKSYLDPTRRGHIVSLSLNGAKYLAKEYGFSIFPLSGKSWAFVAEYKSHSNENEDFKNRIWTALEENLHALTDKKMGSVIKLLGLETSRAYG